MLFTDSEPLENFGIVLDVRFILSMSVQTI